ALGMNRSLSRAPAPQQRGTTPPLPRLARHPMSALDRRVPPPGLRGFVLTASAPRQIGTPVSQAERSRLEYPARDRSPVRAVPPPEALPAWRPDRNAVALLQELKECYPMSTQLPERRMVPLAPPEPLRRRRP